jgi:hypothetical protein
MHKTDEFISEIQDLRRGIKEIWDLMGFSRSVKWHLLADVSRQPTGKKPPFYAA